MTANPTYEQLLKRIEVLEKAAAESGSDELYTRLIATMPDIMVRMDLEGTIQEINHSGLKTSGYERGEIVGQNMLAFIAPEDRERAMQNTVLMFQGKLGPQEYHLLMKDGSRLLFEVNGDLLRDQEGVPFGIVQVCRDITERVRAREALRESEQLHRSVIENSHDGIIIVDDAYHFVYANDEFCRIMAYDRQELLGRDFRDFLAHETRQVVVDRYKRRQEGQTPPSRYEFMVVRKDGEKRWVETSSTVVVDAEGGKRTIAQMLDITERKKNRWERERLENQLRHAQKMEAVGILAGGVAHDFNNILQVISSQIQILNMVGGLTGNDARRLREVDLAIGRASELVQRLLTFSRKVEPNLSLVDVNSEVHEAAKMLERIIPRMISVETTLDPDLEQIEADPNQLNQILLNLGTNASDAMPQGGRLTMTTAKVSLDESYCADHMDAKPGDYIRITVADTGIGMDHQTLEHVFDPFFTTKGVGQGTGLGLAIAYGIVKSHGGHIACESQPGQGATFDIYLPALRGKDLHAQASDQEAPGALAGNELILVVDDEPVIIDTALEMFSRHGYRTASAKSGEEALEYYARHEGQVDLVVMDLGMPGMGGRECLERLLALNPGLKVIIASGYSSRAHEEDLARAGAAGFLAKPYRFYELMGKVRQVLDAGEGRDRDEG